MSMTRFAMLCDIPKPDGVPCGKRSAEYGGWPSCRECLEDVCPEHVVPGSTVEHDEGRVSVLCTRCAADLARADYIDLIEYAEDHIRLARTRNPKLAATELADAILRLQQAAEQIKTWPQNNT